jgi:diguanylate cyclase (GGDEF)-like protein
MDPLRELKRTVEELAAFNEIGKTLTSTLDISEVLKIIMQKIGELLQPENWSLLLVDDKSGELYFETAVGEGADKLRDQRIKIGEGIAGWVAQEGEPVMVSDAQQDPRFGSRFEQLSEIQTTSVLAVPLRSRDRTLGVIELISSRSREQDAAAFSEADVRTLASIADYAAIAIENARNFQRIQELTVVDEHTGLFNSRHLQTQLETELVRARRFDQAVALVFVDLDHFKQVNDSYGHQRGSAFLREVGQLLAQQLRTVDIPVRYGGDEFVVLCPQTDRVQATVCAWRLREAISNHVFLTSEGLAVHITASFGVAAFPQDASSGDDLMRAADLAMYQAKEGGRDQVCAGSRALGA